MGRTTRREFLKQSGVVAGVLIASSGRRASFADEQSVPELYVALPHVHAVPPDLLPWRNGAVTRTPVGPVPWRSPLHVLDARRMLAFDVEYAGLRRATKRQDEPGQGTLVQPRLVGLSREVPLLRFKFPPQHVAEAHFELNSDQPSPRTPVPSALSGPSYVVFQVPDWISSADVGLPTDLESLLDWDRLILRCAPTARSGWDVRLPNASLEMALSDEWRKLPLPPFHREMAKRYGGRERGLLGAEHLERATRAGAAHWVTALELPSQIFLSPHMGAEWRTRGTGSRLGAGEGPGVGSELWCASLVAPFRYDTDLVAAAHRDLKTVRAIWSRGCDDFESAFGRVGDCDLMKAGEVSDRAGRGRDGPWRKMFLPNYHHAHEIVQQSSNFRLGHKKKISSEEVDLGETPGAVQADQLHLASLGATARLHGGWNPSLVSIPRVAKPLQLPTAAHGDWIQPFVVDEWRQETVWGRDAHVLVSLKGYLLPFGHEASLVQVRNREFHQATGWGGSSPVALVRERWLVQIRDPETTYTDVAYRDGPMRGRRNPFASVRLVDERSPFMRPPRAEPGQQPPEGGVWLLEQANYVRWQSDFYPLAVRVLPEEGSASEPYRFGVEATDFQGNQVKFSLPMVWVARTVAERSPADGLRGATACVPGPEQLADILRAYAKRTDERMAALGGQKLALTSGRDDEDAKPTTVAVKSIVFGCETGPALVVGTAAPVGGKKATDPAHPLFWLPEKERKRDDPARKWPGASDFTAPLPGQAKSPPFPKEWDELRWHPAVACVEAELDAVAAMAPASKDTMACVMYADEFVADGFPVPAPAGAASPPNKGEVFARVMGSEATRPKMDHEPERSGGIANPSQGVSGLSRTLGPVAGALDGISQAKFDPLESFGETIGVPPAKILGVVQLMDVLRRNDDLTESPTAYPNVLKEETTAVLDKLKEFQGIAGSAAKALKTIIKVEQMVASGGFESLLETFLEDSLAFATSQLAALDPEAAFATALGLSPTEVGELKGTAERLSGRVLAVRELVAARAEGVKQQGAELATVIGERLGEAKKDAEIAAVRTLREQLKQATAETARWEAMLGGVDLGIEIQGLEFDGLKRVPAQLGHAVVEALRSIPRGLLDPVTAPFRALGRVDLARNPLGAFKSLERALGDIGRAVSDAPTMIGNKLKANVAAAQKELERRVVSILTSAFDEFGSPLGAGLAAIGKRAEQLRADYRQRLTALDGAYAAASAAWPGDAKASFARFRAEAQLSLYELERAGDGLAEQAADQLPRRIEDALEAALKDPNLKKGERIERWISKNVASIQTGIDGAFAKIKEKAEEFANQAAPAKAAWREITEPLKELERLIKPAKAMLARLKAVVDGLPRQLSVGYTWDAELQDWPSSGSGALFVASRTTESGRELESALTIRTAVTQDLQSLISTRPKVQPGIEISAAIRDFTLRFIPSAEFLVVEVEKVSFETNAEGGRDIDVNLASIRLGEAMEFVQSLGPLLSNGTGPFLVPSARGVLVGWQWGFPAITMGALNLYNLAFHVGVRIPFERGHPLLIGLGISSRARPFIVTVGLLGGGGHLALELAAGRLVHVETSIEFGATVGLDLGVATGIVYARGGLFYSRTMDRNTGQARVEFRAYIRAGGSLTVLGLINIYAEFYVGLRRVSRGGQSFAEGVARYTVKIEIAFFSRSVTLEVRKALAGAPPSDGARGAIGDRGVVGPALTSGAYPPEPHVSDTPFGQGGYTSGQPLDERDWDAETIRWDEHLVGVGLDGDDWL